MLQLWFIANTVLSPFATMVGGSTLTLNVVLLLIAGTIALAKTRKLTFNTTRALLVLISFFTLSFIFSLSGQCSDHLQKSVFTMPVLLFLVLMGMEVGYRASESDWLNLQRAAQWALIMAFASFIVEVLIPSRFPNGAPYRAKGELTGLFPEPSQAAVYLFPCIAVLLVAGEKKTRQKGMIALGGLLIVSRSSTLIALTAAWLIYRLLIRGRLHQAMPYILGVTALIGLGAAIDYSRYISPTIVRIVGVFAASEESNISSLVYVQGWQDAWYNLLRTHGMGLGVNMMGCGTLPDVPARLALTVIGLGDLNATDGSFLFAKAVSEIGVFGIAFYIFLICWWIRLEKKLHQVRLEQTSVGAATQTALIFCFVASSFIRTSGYFDGGFLLLVAALCGASRLRLETVNQTATIHAAL